MMQKTFIIIPTYNEKDNIGRLIEFIEEKVFPKIDKAKFAMHILIVDDSSPDGTADLVKKLQKKYKNLSLFLNKKKAGLGGAYMKGMTYAVDELDADLMFQMDADFSHDPLVIHAFLDKIDKGYDLVLGSRYIKGGSIPEDWGIHRKFMSLVGNLIVRAVLWTWTVNDWTTGYRAIKKEVFESLRKEMDRKEFSGYTWQIGFLHKTQRKGFKIAEVPINFIDREFGKSKIGAEYIKNTLLYIFKIRIRELDRIIKFAVVGVIGFVVNLTALEVFYKAFGIRPDNAAAMGAELAIISNFCLNNLWTFKDRKISDFRKLIIKFLQFNLTSLGAVLIQKVGVWLGLKFFGESYYLLYFIASVAVGMVYNFVMYNKVIWKKEN
ncbi:glycosyltransferase family 2 protein [Candidatus Beckwithbacteria bacterium]|nr:glycosyltransferase family 2 protein [Candidatus Beckwithbacteria bacterium]